MRKTPVYGLPLNPMPLLDELAGASFCVSFATRDKLGKELDRAIELVGKDGLLIVDNGSFSYHERGIDTRGEAYLTEYEAWAGDILARCPNAVAVVPDVIGGTEAENAKLVRETLLPWERAMPIWHMHESLDYLIWLCEAFEYVGFGSSGKFWKVGTPEWHARIAEAFAAIETWEAESEGAYIRPRIHMMRAQSMAHMYEFDSSDSTNVAVNHGRYRAGGPGHVGRFAARVAGKIAASCDGAESEWQAKRPILGHIEWTAFRERFWAELAAYKVEEWKEAA
jgi:hypothetical protein